MKKHLFALWLITFSGYLPINGWALNLIIWPISPSLTTPQQTTELWLENQDSHNTVMQIRLFAWRQQQGTNLYAEQNEILLSPPMVNIASKTKQLIRIINTQPAQVEQERAYRIIIDEIPNPLNNTNDKPQTGFKVQMRYSLPFFVYGKNIITNTYQNQAQKQAITQPKLSYTLKQIGQKKQLFIHNAGVIHAHLTDVKTKDGQNLTEAIGYVLPNATMTFPLTKSYRLSATENLSATINDQNDVVILPDALLK